MAYILLNRAKLRHNYDFLTQLFKEKEIEWAIVSKLFCGNSIFLEELLSLNPGQLCDSRISNLKAIKKINPRCETIYIKPPPHHYVSDVVRYADISLNTHHRTLELLSAEAVKQDVIHKVIIMIELGELREGILQKNIKRFYEKAISLPNIQVVGIGTNFSCLSGVLPSYEKLSQLVSYREMLINTFNQPLPWVSGGTSVTIPLIYMNQLPAGVNHFRVGETLFFGTDVYNGVVMEGMSQDVITFYAEIIELKEKPLTPDGQLGQNVEGHTPEFNPEDYGKTSWRAIVDAGLLDVESAHVIPIDQTIEHIGASSDMLIVNLGENPHKYKVGDYIEFRTDYMGVLRLMNSRYIKKRIKVD